MIAMMRILFVLVVLVYRTFADFGDLRINGGGNSGRLEFQMDDDTWGTVCDQGFDDDAANAACEQLGYVGYISVLRNQNYDPGDMPIAVCDTFCMGEEDKYTDCQYNMCDDTFTCQHYEDVGINCGEDINTVEMVLIGVGSVLFVMFLLITVISCGCCVHYYLKHADRRLHYFRIQEVEEVQVTTATVKTATVKTATVNKLPNYSTIPQTEHQSVPQLPTTQ